MKNLSFILISLFFITSCTNEYVIKEINHMSKVGPDNTKLVWPNYNDSVSDFDLEVSRLAYSSGKYLFIHGEVYTPKMKYILTLENGIKHEITRKEYYTLMRNSTTKVKLNPLFGLIIK